MIESQVDALVLFGATGDLAFKKIFPALQAMIKRGHLTVTVIGVAKANRSEAELRDCSLALVLLELHPGSDAVQCVATSRPELMHHSWPVGPFLHKVLAGRRVSGIADPLLDAWPQGPSGTLSGSSRPCICRCSYRDGAA